MPPQHTRRVAIRDLRCGQLGWHIVGTCVSKCKFKDYGDGVLSYFRLQDTPGGTGGTGGTIRVTAFNFPAAHVHALVRVGCKYRVSAGGAEVRHASPDFARAHTCELNVFSASAVEPVALAPPRAPAPSHDPAVVRALPDVRALPARSRTALRAHVADVGCVRPHPRSRYVTLCDPASRETMRLKLLAAHADEVRDDDAAAGAAVVVEVTGALVCARPGADVKVEVEADGKAQVAVHRGRAPEEPAAPPAGSPSLPGRRRREASPGTGAGAGVWRGGGGAGLSSSLLDMGTASGGERIPRLRVATLSPEVGPLPSHFGPIDSMFRSGGSALGDAAPSTHAVRPIDIRGESVANTAHPEATPSPPSQLQGVASSAARGANAQRPTAATMANGRKFSVFISHAGPDKKKVALPLYNQLKDRKISAFFDKEEIRPGDTVPDVLKDAMERAIVGVFILSPEFAARKWPMREAHRFITRHEEAKGRGEPWPVIIPVFHRMDAQQCKSSEFYSLLGINREEVFWSSGFFDDDRKKERSTEDVSRWLTFLANKSGVYEPEYSKAAMEGTNSKLVECIADTVVASFNNIIQDLVN